MRNLNMTYNVQHPILLITFIKFDTALRVLNNIKNVKPTKLYLASDGGRNFEEHVKIQEFRKQILKSIDWNCQIFTLFSEINLGCKQGPNNAINWFFQNEKSGIILEDDCIPSISFYRFCDELLEKYKNDKDIYLISGLSYCEQMTKDLNFDYSFAKLSHTNGWASWSRAWNNVAIEYKDFGLSFDDLSSNLFHSKEEKVYWKKIFKKWKKLGFDNAWDYQWLFHIWKNKGLGIYPHINMIKNIGLDHNSSTHKITDQFLLNLQANDIFFPIRHPQQISRNIQLEKKDFYMSRTSKNILKRIIKKILAFFQ